MSATKKFTVVKLTEVSEPGRNPYKVVPSFWIKNANDNYVTIPYPPDEKLSLTFDRILNCQLPLAEWEDHHAVVEREAETYQAGILYVKRQSTAPLDEETLLLWKRVSLECVEKIGSLHPVKIFYRFWSLLWNLVGK